MTTEKQLKKRIEKLKAQIAALEKKRKPVYAEYFKVQQAANKLGNRVDKLDDARFTLDDELHQAERELDDFIEMNTP